MIFDRAAEGDEPSRMDTFGAHGKRVGRETTPHPSMERASVCATSNFSWTGKNAQKG